MVPRSWFRGYLSVISSPRISREAPINTHGYHWERGTPNCGTLDSRWFKPWPFGNPSFFWSPTISERVRCSPSQKRSPAELPGMDKMLKNTNLHESSFVHQPFITCWVYLHQKKSGCDYQHLNPWSPSHKMAWITCEDSIDQKHKNPQKMKERTMNQVIQSDLFIP